LNSPQTEEAVRSIRPAYHGIPAKLQHLWDYVTVLDDFPKIGSAMERDENGELQLPDEQELNLLISILEPTAVDDNLVNKSQYLRFRKWALDRG